MKYLIICLILSFTCCSSVRQLEKLPKPAVVWAAYEADDFCVMIIRDNTGKMQSLRLDDELFAIVKKYAVGDTVR